MINEKKFSKIHFGDKFMVGIQNDNSYTISTLPETYREKIWLKELMSANNIPMNNVAWIE